MWSGGKEENQHGEAVLLFQPVIKSKSKAKAKAKSKSSNSTNKINVSNESYLGGCPSYFSDDEMIMISNPTTNLKCENCQNPLSHIAQINAPMDNLERTLYVFGCNSSGNLCCRQLQKTNDDNDNQNDYVRFWNGKGVFRCIRSQYKRKDISASIQISMNNKELNNNDWNQWDVRNDDNNNNKNNNDDDDDDDDESDGGWGVTTTNESHDDDSHYHEAIKSMKELEVMVNAHEINESNKRQTIQTKENNKTIKDENEVRNNQINSKFTCLSNASFPQYQLELFDEPYASTEYLSDSDGDEKEYLGTKDDHELESMLTRYLKEDQDLDPQIAKLLQSKTKIIHETNSHIKNEVSQKQLNNDGEKYERLPPDQRILMSYMERIKRAPNQVVRYAYGGEPLWSA